MRGLLALEAGTPAQVMNALVMADRRFWPKVRWTTGCWYWTASIDALGYGRMNPAHRTLGEVKAHRFAYRLFNGPIPAGMHVLHACDVRHCVNPHHLGIGTHLENMRDMMCRERWATGDNSGEKNGQAKLTRAKVAEIRTLLADGHSQAEVARRFGMSKMAISQIARGASWK